MHIGLIGGIGPAATEFYYRQLTIATSRENRHLDLTIVHADLRDLLDNLASDSRTAQAEVFHGLTARLKAAGADVVAITSMAGHFCIQEFEKVSPLPVCSAIEAVRADLIPRGINAVGLLGTRAVMISQLFGGLKGFAVKIPDGDVLERTDREYIAMARAGCASEPQREFFFETAHRLHRAGADVVLLAGTDLFLAFDGRDCGVVTIDCATVHIASLLRLTSTKPD
ncbi:MAG TPA: aspartate/glutamate racemase family protein [Gammaproteobacteria bacterium]|nr:aspartate/glutamate racemase family protein [Gammaproteobacteria bacterium]